LLLVTTKTAHTKSQSSDSRLTRSYQIQSNPIQFNPITPESEENKKGRHTCTKDMYQQKHKHVPIGQLGICLFSYTPSFANTNASSVYKILQAGTTRHAGTPLEKLAYSIPSAFSLLSGHFIRLHGEHLRSPLHNTGFHLLPQRRDPSILKNETPRTCTTTHAEHVSCQPSEAHIYPRNSNNNYITTYPLSWKTKPTFA